MITRKPLCYGLAFLLPLAFAVSFSQDLTAHGLYVNEKTPFTEGRTSSGYIFDAYPPIYYPQSLHWLNGLSPLGDSVELEDGSIWRISRYDRPKALTWRANDPIAITQNHRWFAPYHYRLINQNTGSCIETELFLSPFPNGEHTIHIHGIDYARGSLVLTNDRGDLTRWEISSGDYDILQNWAPNDIVIIGQNSGWDVKCESILINVNMDDAVRANNTNVD